MSSVRTLQELLWNNAGFGRLRVIRELDHYEAWHVPAVIPIAPADSEAIPISTIINYDSLTGPPRATGTVEEQAGRSYHSILDYHAAYKSGKLTPSDVAEGLLPLIKREDVQQRSEHSVAFLETRTDLVRKAAEESTRRYQAGEALGVLDGVPIAVKDEVHVKGYKLRSGSRNEIDVVQDETAWCVRQWEEQGVVNLGKLNMHELGSGMRNLF